MTFYQKWFLASRPWSFTMTAISVSVGSAMAAVDGAFFWKYYFLALIGIVFLHGASNLLNDYYDVKHGVDSAGVSTALYRPHPLVEGKISAASVFVMAIILFSAGCAIGIFLAVSRGFEILIIGMAGILGGLFYTAPPVRYKYMALGEAGVFVLWGPLMVEGAYFVQRQTFCLNAFWVSIPFGLLVALVLLANNIRDIDHDRPRNIVTLPILMGKNRALNLYLTIIALAYVLVFAMSVAGPLSVFSLIIFVSVPVAVDQVKTMLEKVPLDADARTAKLNTAFGVLMVVSIVLESIFL